MEFGLLGATKLRSELLNYETGVPNSVSQPASHSHFLLRHFDGKAKEGLQAQGSRREVRAMRTKSTFISKVEKST